MPVEPVRFAVLGPVRAWRGDAELDLGGPQERALLALLLARAGQPVAVSEIVELLWGTQPPRSAVNVVRRHVGSLRRLLEPALAPRATGAWLVRAAGGYRLRLDGDSCDLLRFRELRAESEGQEPARALELLVRALALWQGPTATDLAPRARAHPAFTAVEAERLATVRDAADSALRNATDSALRNPADTVLRDAADAALPAADADGTAARDAAPPQGAPERVLPALRRAADDHPLDEPVLARLIRVLAVTGRRAEALAAYEAARARLADELGIDPGVELRDAHGEAAREEAPARQSRQRSVATVLVPSQLPPALPAFTGREAELAGLRALLSGADEPTGANDPGGADAPRATDTPARTDAPGRTIVIGALGGMAGVGKTTLAVHCAHLLADRFPDGRLYVNLRGFDPSGAVMEPGEAVRGFLHALGVPPERVPHGLDAQTSLYRGLLEGRRMLILLDNARDTDHVRPLLPGTPGCLTLVTSRNELSGLIAAHGARSLTLRPFGDAEARQFLARRLDTERIEADPRATDEIIRRCAGLPLALACVAARAALHPGFPLSAVAAELREGDGSLDAFARSDASLDVGTVFSWSVRAVSPEAARLFRLLALHPGPDVTAPAAAALTQLPARRVRPLLAELAAARLLEEPAPGRYAFHDLLRAHATELLHEEHPEPDRRQATRRLRHHYLHTAHAAAALLASHADPLPLPPLPEGAAPQPLADDDRALAWLAAEYAVLLAVVDTAAADGDDKVACLLAWALEPFFDRRGHWHDGAAAQRTALTAALRLHDPALEARGLRGLARAEGRLGLHEQSLPRLTRALELYTGLGDALGRAEVHRSLGWEAEQRDDLDGALRHNRLALGLLRAHGAHAAQARVLNSVGWYHALRGEYADALEHCHEALTLLQDLGDRYGQAATWDSIAYAHHHLGRHPQALLGYRNCLTLLRELGVPYLEGVTLIRLGDTHLATGDHDGAHSCWAQALALLTRLGHPDAGQAAARLAGRATGTPHDPCAERR